MNNCNPSGENTRRKILQIGLAIAGIFFFCSPSVFSQNGIDSIDLSTEALYSKSYTYKTLSAYQKSIFDQLIQAEFPAGTNISAALTDYASTRNKTRLAELLLFRNESGDKENAIFILKWVLKYQDKDKSNTNYGIWRTSVLKDRFDQNWREFIGCDLIIIYHKYRNLLPSDLVRQIEEGLIHAAQGAFRRDVSPSYSNISIMSAFLMEYTGTAFKIDKLKNAGLQKARDVFLLYRTNNTFSEYNSPTYYGVTFVAIALWRELAFSTEMKEMGKILERALWQESALFYNPTLKNMTGPYFRGYGMDMRKYYSIVGIWMAIAMDDENLSPMPRNEGAKYNEMSNIAPILHLGISIPKANLLQLKEFTSARYITRIVPNNYPGDTLKKVTAIVNESWMMGGLWGNRKPWGQIKTGTIHWKTPDGDIGWLLVPGDGKTNVNVTKTKMSIYLADKSATNIQIYVCVKGLTIDNFKDEYWELSGMSLEIDTDLQETFNNDIDRSVLLEKCAITEVCNAVVKVDFEIPLSWNIEDKLLEITPKR